MTRLLITLTLTAALVTAAAHAGDAPPASAKRFGTWGIDLDGMDRTVKPGDDFSRYVNGKWAAATAIPADKTSVGAFQILRDLSEERVRGIVEGWSADKSLKGDEAKVATIYRTFLDEATVESLDAKPIAPLLGAVKKAETRNDIARLMAHSNVTFGKTLFALSVGDDAKDPDM